jgi:hypothetical protein
MPKYYVKSGTLEIIIDDKNCFEAAIKGLMLTNKFDTIDEHFYVDERGYRDYITATPDTNVIATRNIVRAAGWELSKDDPPANKTEPPRRRRWRGRGKDPLP